jgi:hypothetical protein
MIPRAHSPLRISWMVWRPWLCRLCYWFAAACFLLLLLPYLVLPRWRAAPPSVPSHAPAQPSVPSHACPDQPFGDSRIEYLGEHLTYPRNPSSWTSPVSLPVAGLTTARFPPHQVCLVISMGSRDWQLELEWLWRYPTCRILLVDCKLPRAIRTEMDARTQWFPICEPFVQDETRLFDNLQALWNKSGSSRVDLVKFDSGEDRLDLRFLDQWLELVRKWTHGNRSDVAARLMPSQIIVAGQGRVSACGELQRDMSLSGYDWVFPFDRLDTREMRIECVWLRNRC